METFDQRHNVITLRADGSRVFPENEPSPKPKTRTEIQAEIKEWIDATPPVSNE